MDINSYEALVVIETMREHGAPLSVLTTATGLPESKLKYYCHREDIGICWIEVYLSILRREDTGRKFSMESLLEKEPMQFCRRRNATFWRDVERRGCIPQMVEDILIQRSVGDTSATSIFDLRRYGADREQFLHRAAEIFAKIAQLPEDKHSIPRLL